MNTTASPPPSRSLAIMNLPSALGREDLARHLIDHTTMSIEEADRVLNLAPESGEGIGKAIVEQFTALKRGGRR